jgi:hypothetical protein
MGSATKFRQTALPRQVGELGRLRVLQGPDMGCVFVVTGQKATIGRGEENDVVLTDLKSSRLHAEVAYTPEGWVVRDLGSSNGILVNGLKSRSQKIASGDTFQMGETILEFQGAEQATRVLVAPVKSMEEARAARERQAKQAEQVRLAVTGRAPVAAVPASADDRAKRVRILLIAVGGIAAYLMLEDMGGSAKKRHEKPVEKKEEASRDLAAMLPQAANAEIAKRADEFFRAGFREYRAGNYLRARQQFETVLQIAPSHDMARRYIENCRIEMDRAAKEYLSRGKNAMEAGKIKEAQGQFEAVLRLYHSNQTNEHYQAAKVHLEELRVMIEKGEAS